VDRGAEDGEGSGDDQRDVHLGYGPIESGGGVTKVSCLRATVALRYEPAASAAAGSIATRVSRRHVAREEPVRGVCAVFGSLIVLHPYTTVWMEITHWLRRCQIRT
jgi:hypothetical protein